METTQPKKYKPSVALTRKVAFYPPEKHIVLIKGMAKITGGSCSAAVGKIIKTYFDEMPEKKKEQLKRASKNSY